MFSERMTAEELSLICVHYAYRNTSLENYHCKSVIMDETLYKTMHRIVARNLNYIKQFLALDLNIHDENDLKEAAYSFRPSIGKHFFRFFGEFIYKSGSDWEKPKELDIPVTKNLATFILGGKFVECCKIGAQLDDTTMCIINKDVHNRIYTLLRQGIL